MHFSHALGREVEFVILSEQIPLARASCAIDALRDAQKMCAVTKVGTVLKSLYRCLLSSCFCVKRGIKFLTIFLWFVNSGECGQNVL